MTDNDYGGGDEYYNDYYTRTTPPTDDEENSPQTAAALSAVVTGLGQAYNGEYAKGAFLFGLQLVNVVLMGVGIGFLTFLLVWAFGIIDAYGGASDG